MKSPTTDQLRHAIDRGATGEKVDFPDLAAVPLGTDDEAAGFTPTRRERRLVAATAPQVSPARPRNWIIPLVVLLFVGVAGLVLFAGYLGKG